MPFLVTILANKSNSYGISRDVEGLYTIFASRGYTVCVRDPLEPPTYTDVAIHLEIPIHVWMPWAHKNILVVNPEWYIPSSWDSYLKRFDTVIVKDLNTAKNFPQEIVKVVRWGLPARRFVPRTLKDEFIWALGASVNKRAYVPTLVKAWKPTYPRLVISTTTPLEISVPANVSIVVKDFTAEERAEYFGGFKGHVCCSRAEGFGYTAAEAESIGAFTILNSLPCYVESYGNDENVAFIPSKMENAYYDMGASPGALEEALDLAMEAFASYSDKQHDSRIDASLKRWEQFAVAMAGIIVPAERPVALARLPPVLDASTAPQISIVTLLYNRKRFFDLACHSIMVSDYPKDKIEWIIVDDSDDVAEQASDRIMAVAETSAPLRLVYVPLKKKTPVSVKRNIGTAKATADIVLIMDDDDHYPETSFRRRVAWLTMHPWKPRAVAATTIACYDLLNGISAVNCPPMDIPLAQRISEATLTFYKSWWEERGFPTGVVVGEGEEFLKGREGDLLEIPPQQIIVAFSHGKNVSSRRVPSDTDVTPGCFWGFPKEFLEFIHRLAGVTVTDTVECQS